MTNFRFVLAVISVPALTAIFGLLWFWDKKKKKKRLPRNVSTDKGLPQHDDLQASNESDPNRETLINDRHYSEEDEDAITLLNNIEEISIKASNSLTTSSYRSSKLKSEEIRQLNGRRDISPGQHVDTCIAATVDDAALCYQLPGKHHDLETLPGDGNIDIGNISVAGGCKITDWNPVDVASGQSDVCGDAIVDSDTAAILATLHSSGGSSDQKCTNRGEESEDEETTLLVSSCRGDASESFRDKNQEQEEEEEELVSNSSHSCHGDVVGEESHNVNETKDEEEVVQECELGRQEPSHVSALKLDSLSIAADTVGVGDMGAISDQVHGRSKQQDPEPNETHDLSESSGFDRNKSGHDDDGDGDDEDEDDGIGQGVDDDLLRSDVQANAEDNNSNFRWVRNDSAEVMDDSSILKVGEVIVDSPELVTQVGDDLRKQGDKVNVDSYSQIQSIDAISAVFSSNSLNVSKLKKELESLQGSAEATHTSTPKRTTTTTEDLLQSAKELFHETKSITPPETESEKDVLTESMESDPVVEDDDSRNISTSEGVQSDGSGDVYLSSLSQTPPFHQQKKEAGAEHSVTKSSGSISYSSPLANSVLFEAEKVQCQVEESGAKCAVIGSKSDDTCHLKTVDSPEKEGLSSESLLLKSTAETVSQSGEDGTLVEVCGRDTGAVGASSFDSSDQNADEIARGQQLQSDNNDSRGGEDETLSNTVCEGAPNTGQSESMHADKAESMDNNPVDNSVNCDVTEHCASQDGGETNRAGSSSKLEYSAATFVPPDSNFQSNSPSCDFTNVPQCEDSLQNPSSNKLYEFYFPLDLCGLLIGRQGKTISQIKERSGACITLQPSPYTPNHKICSIGGSEEQIQDALKRITEKIPPSVYGNIDLTPIQDTSQLASNPVVMPDLIQLNLPQEGVSVNILVASIIDAGHLFLQLPTHPTYVALNRLNKFMNRCYSQPGMVPHLPRPLAVGVICAAPMMDSWYRAVIVAVSEESDECEIKFVDYGGYSQVSWNDLRQIRSDFMTLPFQAVEVYLANITPLPDEPYFSDAAVETLQQLTESGILQAQVVSRAEDGTAYVHIYQINGNKVTFINRELVNRNVVQWIEIL